MKAIRLADLALRALVPLGILAAVLVFALALER